MPSAEIGSQQEPSGSLEVQEDLRFQRRAWVAQRIGWLTLALVITAAVAGFFGDGPVSDASKRSDDSALTVDYARFPRHLAPTAVSVTVAPDAVEDEVELWISTAWLEGVDLEGVVPEPESVAATDDRVVFTFAAAESDATFTATFQVRHEALGRRLLEVGRPGGGRVHARQFIFP